MIVIIMFHCCFVQHKKNQNKSTPCLKEIETYVREIKVPSNKESKQLRDKKNYLVIMTISIMIVMMEKSLFFFSL